MAGKKDGFFYIPVTAPTTTSTTWTLPAEAPRLSWDYDNTPINKLLSALVDRCSPRTYYHLEQGFSGALYMSISTNESGFSEKIALDRVKLAGGRWEEYVRDKLIILAASLGVTVAPEENELGEIAP